MDHLVHAPKKARTEQTEVQGKRFGRIFLHVQSDLLGGGDTNMTQTIGFFVLALVLAAAIAAPALAAGSPGFASTHSFGTATRTVSAPYASARAAHSPRR